MTWTTDLVLPVLTRVVDVGEVEGAAVVRVRQVGLPDRAEVVDGGEGVQRGCPLQQQLLNILQAVGRQ